ncbi:Serine carboxypeptidase-like 33, partial [Striga hermonthica]
PGCSSIGFGAAIELGPLIVVENGLEYNQQSWYKEANLLFVESPVGVGFSYTNTPSDFNNMDDKFVAEDTYIFMVRWLKKFRQFQHCNFFIAGESYAGRHYVPQLAELVYDRNKMTNKYPHINFKGFIVGNPETSDEFDNQGILEFAWSHSIISDQTYYVAKKTCDFRTDDWSDPCADAMISLWNQYNDIDFYNIYAPSCLANTTSTFLHHTALTGKNFSYTKACKMQHFLQLLTIPPIQGHSDPCSSQYTNKYFNRKDVQKALHVNCRKHGSYIKWQECNYTIFGAYNRSVFSVLPIYKKLTNAGLKIWMYSGDVDGRVPFIGSRYCVENLNLTLKTPWTNWYYDHQVAGRMVEYEGLTFLTVRGAGHSVPSDKPNETLALIHSYLTGQPLQTHK